LADDLARGEGMNQAEPEDKPRPCMGGFCAERLACEHYEDPHGGIVFVIGAPTPSENLCNEIARLKRDSEERP
jgi:hypothetical protein